MAMASVYILCLAMVFASIRLIRPFPFGKAVEQPPETIDYCYQRSSPTWGYRAGRMNCTNGTVYHCAKDYDSPKSPPNCSQSDPSGCIKERFVEACAKEKKCSIGEEPVLSFVKNQQPVDPPEVFCVPCYNINRYNPNPLTTSSDYSECQYKKENICTKEKHKILCEDDDSTRERSCRCDARNGYYPEFHPYDHPYNGCSDNAYDCTNDRPECVGQQLFLNYSCAPLCRDGYHRPDNFDDCIPDPTRKPVTSSTEKYTTSELSTTSTNAVTNTTAKMTSKITTVNPKPTEGSSTDPTLIIVLIVVGAVVVLVIVIALVIVFIRCKKQRSKQCSGIEEIELRDQTEQALSSSGDSSNVVHKTNGEEDIEKEKSTMKGRGVEMPVHKEELESLLNDGTESNENIGGAVKTHPDTRKEHVDDKGIEESRPYRHKDIVGGISEVQVHHDPLQKGSQRLSVDDEGKEHVEALPPDVAEEHTSIFEKLMQLPSYHVKGTDGKTKHLKVNKASVEERPSIDLAAEARITDATKFGLDHKTSSELVARVMDKCYRSLLDKMDASYVLDILTVEDVWLHTLRRDIRESKNSTEMNRNLINQIRKSGIDIYQKFKKSLLKSKQYQCLHELEDEQTLALQELNIVPEEEDLTRVSYAKIDPRQNRDDLENKSSMTLSVADPRQDLEKEKSTMKRSSAVMPVQQEELEPMLKDDIKSYEVDSGVVETYLETRKEHADDKGVEESRPYQHKEIVRGISEVQVLHDPLHKGSQPVSLFSKEQVTKEGTQETDQYGIEPDVFPSETFVPSLQYLATKKVSCDRNILPDDNSLKKLCSAFGKDSKVVKSMCNNICARIKKDHEPIETILPVYRENDENSLEFVAFGKLENIETIQLLDLKITVRRENETNSENREMIEKEVREKKMLNQEEIIILQNVINTHVEQITKNHSNVTYITGSPFKSRKYSSLNPEIIEEPCVVILVNVKGLIPINEKPFHKQLENDGKRYSVDVREGIFQLYMGNYHENLKHGCVIGSEKNASKYGTLGGFVNHPNYGLCALTCAHVVLPDNMLKKNTTDVVCNQPHTENLQFGILKKHVFAEKLRTSSDRTTSSDQTSSDTEIGIDAALIKVDQARVPLTGKFPNIEQNEKRNAGFEEHRDLSYTSGKVHEGNLLKIKDHRLIKVGAATGLRHGHLAFTGSSCVSSHLFYKSIFILLKNQIQVNDTALNKFSDHGDSGSLVFSVSNDSHDLVAVGLLVGGGEGYSVFTPIDHVLDFLGCDAPYSLKTFEK